jgi:hypothetical protein
MRSLVISLVLLLAACEAKGPPSGPEETCTRACVARVSRCDESKCARGCNLALDRLQEKEGETVLGCVARGKGACDDQEWASCAVHVGSHLDGGPPPPPPPSDDYE